MFVCLFRTIVEGHGDVNSSKNCSHGIAISYAHKYYIKPTEVKVKLMPHAKLKKKTPHQIAHAKI